MNLYQVKNNKEYIFNIGDLVKDVESRQKISMELLKELSKDRKIAVYTEQPTQGYFAFCKDDHKIFMDYELTKGDSPFNLNQAKIKGLKVSTNNPQDLDPINQILQKYI